MALTVEDGSIVSGADSYVTRSEYIAYAAKIGVTIADTDATDEQLVKAARYIDSLEGRLKGWLVERDQPLAFPRSGLWIDSWAWNSTEIPTNVKDAQMELALDLNDGIDLYNVKPSDATPVKRERIEDAVEVEYAISQAGPMQRRSRADSLLNSLMRGGGLTVPLVMA